MLRKSVGILESRGNPCNWMKRMEYIDLWNRTAIQAHQVGYSRVTDLLASCITLKNCDVESGARETLAQDRRIGRRDGKMEFNGLNKSERRLKLISASQGTNRERSLFQLTRTILQWLFLYLSQSFPIPNWTLFSQTFPMDLTQPASCRWARNEETHLQDVELIRATGRKTFEQRN